MLAETTRLLGLRRDVVVTLAKSGYDGAAATMPRADVVDCTWRFGAGTLRFVANVGTEAFAVDPGGARPVWTNAPDGAGRDLPSWTGVFLTESHA